MAKYCISGSNAYTDPIGGGASAKAPADVATALEHLGYKHLFIPHTQGGKWKNVIASFKAVRNILKKISKDDEVLIQYPRHRLLWLNLLFSKRFRKVSFLIHDINSVRVTGKLDRMEKMCLNCADEIIVHSPEMENFLRPLLKKRLEYKVLGCFDYIVPIAQDNFKRNLSNDICFAGNIDKSAFIPKFLDVMGDKIHLNLYGLMRDNKIPYKNYSYEGAFTPDHINGLKGSWGLVWDGDELGSCGGTFGNYLRIIAPHKFSLYIVAGLPPIVWSNSAMAKIVKEQEIGLCVDSLENLSEQIEKITPQQYRFFVKQLTKFAYYLAEGRNIKNVVK